MTSALSITLCAALVLAAFVAAEAKGKGPSITHKVSIPPSPPSPFQRSVSLRAMQRSLPRNSGLFRHQHRRPARRPCHYGPVRHPRIRLLKCLVMFCAATARVSPKPQRTSVPFALAKRSACMFDMCAHVTRVFSSVSS